MIVNYKKGIHPDCGKKYKVHKDIIMTPFYTEKFCDEIVKIAQFYNDKFEPNIKYTNPHNVNTGEDIITELSPWNTLYISNLSHIMFENFVEQYKKYLCPLIEKTFGQEKVKGWFSPFIIKYEKGDKVALHTDTSDFTMNVKLNTNYEGADLYFPRQKFNNKILPKGWCILWPSTVTHPHQASELKKGKKYTLASWTHPHSWNVNEIGGSIFNSNKG
tara:strand:- start:20 stop:670 length:651 start_codon:yes stop_codon:yes gene_type:complete